MKEPTISVMQANSVCGDEIEVFFRVEKETIIEWSRYGKPAMQTSAAASMLAEVIEGNPFKEILTRDYEFMKNL